MGLNLKVGDKSKFYAFGVFHFENETEAIMLKFSIFSETGLKKDLRLFYEFTPGTGVFTVSFKEKGNKEVLAKKAYDTFITSLIPELTKELETKRLKKTTQYRVFVEDGNPTKMIDNLKDSGTIWYGEGKTEAEARANLITQKTGDYDGKKR